MKRIIYFSILIFMISCTHQSVKYPVTRKDDVKDNYFGTEVDDPYRWLEDDNSEETAEWVKAQNKTTFSYLEKLPNRAEIKQQLTDVLDYPKHGTPFKKAGKYFYFKNNGLQNQNVLYKANDLKSEPQVVLDPNTLSTDGTVALSGVDISDDGKYLVYMIARSGSDWNEIFVKNIETGEQLSDHIEWVKFSDLAWYDGGFYYSAYDKPLVGTELSESNQHQKIYYHKLGTDQSKDVLVLEDQEHPKRMLGAGITDDKRFLLVSMNEASNGNALSVRDLDKKGSDYVPLMKSFDYEFIVVDNIGEDLFVRTNYKASRYRLVKININHPEEENWTETIPEKEEVLQTVSLVGGKIVAEYMKDARSKVDVYDYDGLYDYEIELPGIGSCGAFSGKKDEPVAFYSYTSFNTPGEIYSYNFDTEKSELFYRPDVKFNPDDFEVKQEFYNSKTEQRCPCSLCIKRELS